MALSAQTYHASSGVNIRWGLGSSCITVTNATGIFQSADYEETVEKYEARDCRGVVTAVAFYNPTATATIEYIASSSSSIDGNAAITKPDQGATVTVTTATGDNIAGTNWLVESVTQKEMNTDAVKVTLKLIRYLNILT